MFDSQATNVYISFARLVNCANNVKQGCLATTGCAQDGDELALVYRNINSTKCRHTFDTEKVSLMHVGQLNHLLGRFVDSLIALAVVFVLNLRETWGRLLSLL